jgi:hypothetical protein
MSYSLHSKFPLAVFWTLGGWNLNLWLGSAFSSNRNEIIGWSLVLESLLLSFLLLSFLLSLNLFAVFMLGFISLSGFFLLQSLLFSLVFGGWNASFTIASWASNGLSLSRSFVLRALPLLVALNPTVVADSIH